MINLGISAAKQRRFHEALCSDHAIKVTVMFLDLEHHYVLDASTRLIDGQVNIDATQAVRRSATLSMLDADFTLGLDSDNPGDGQAFLDRMVRIIYSVWVDNDWVDVPVFVGPITRIERNGDVIEIEAQGKEVLARRPAYKTRTWNKNLNRVNVIESIMEELTGEDHFNLPNGWTAKTAKAIVVDPQKQPWSYATSLAKSMKAMLFYDGRGFLRLRKRSTRAQFTFRDGDGGSVLTLPDYAFATDDIINIVEVTGAMPKGKKKKIKAKAQIPKWHQLSPERLGRNGVPRYLPEYIEDETLKSQKEVDNAAARRIKELMSETVEAAFDSLPIPHLEEDDLVRVSVGGEVVAFRLRKMTIPLSHGGVSSIGYLKKVSRNTKSIRRNR